MTSAKVTFRSSGMSPPVACTREREMWFKPTRHRSSLAIILACQSRATESNLVAQPLLNDVLTHQRLQGWASRGLNSQWVSLKIKGNRRAYEDVHIFLLCPLHAPPPSSPVSQRERERERSGQKSRRQDFGIMHPKRPRIGTFADVTRSG